MQRRNLETAAAKYSHLRGLLAIPLGVLLILAALANWEVGRCVISGLPRRRARSGRCAWPSTATTTRTTGGSARRPGSRCAPPSAVVLGLAVMGGGVAPAAQPGGLVARSPRQRHRGVLRPGDAVSYGPAWVSRPPRDHLGHGPGGGRPPVWNGADPSNIGLLLAGGAVMRTALRPPALRPHLRPARDLARGRCRSLRTSWSSIGSSTSRAGWRS